MAFDWKITLVKGLKSAAIVVCAGLISVWQADVKYMALVPFVEMALNYLKHRND
ncbi:MAG: hypothetical protein WC307_06355 [Candidatus Nanoarchaeia archaeon]|jgi:hypothetical protein